jgi:hypothetical protein
MGGPTFAARSGDGMRSTRLCGDLPLLILASLGVNWLINTFDISTP